MLLLKCALVEGIHAVWASLQVESALRDCRTAARRGFVAPRWRPPLVRPSDRIVYTARSSGRQRHLLLAPEVTDASQVFSRPLGAVLSCILWLLLFWLEWLGPVLWKSVVAVYDTNSPYQLIRL
ncbi:hypothetical protein NDU88_002183 [Pleurodeles waltl]|uniref:Secreted protein n=1 Tax=Pleurodeles waltl TaxID=8319 RepID=A0AAV7KRE9_PLEWA|nr:hypothetical protein NDU88_002183 [Pleurodeles waltl]